MKVSMQHYILYCVLFFNVSCRYVLAQTADTSNFDTRYYVEYRASETGITQVKHQIKIINRKDDYFVSAYSIKIRDDSIGNIKGDSEGRRVDVTQTKEDDITTLTARFSDFIIGKGKENLITISYDSSAISSKVGKVWNINIPKAVSTSDVDQYNLLLTVPKSFGQMIYLSPLPNETTDSSESYKFAFTKDSIEKNGVTASFGKYQEINFRLQYQLENPGVLTANYNIALPPEIKHFQQLKYTTLRPTPQKIHFDKDNNVIATYKLKPRQRLTAELMGTARISTKQIDLSSSSELNKPGPISFMYPYINSDKFWPTKSETIQKLAKNLLNKGENVAQNAYSVYEHLVNTYAYDNTLISNSWIERKGADEAIVNNSKWGCMEFTDTFVTLTRAMGIPSRALTGYALTEDSQSKPISIISKGGDKLHTWPEFYDKKYGWVQVDPTWGDTSGMDYFTKLDTNHFVLAIRGQDSEYPLAAGEYRTTDSDKLVEVLFTDSNNDVEFKPKVTIQKVIPISPIQILKGNSRYLITNTGDTFVYLPNGRALAPSMSTHIYVNKSTSDLILLDYQNKQSLFKLN